MLIVSTKNESLDYILNTNKLVNESTFQNAKDWSKYGFKYAIAVIDKLLNGETIRLGQKGDNITGEVSGRNLSRSDKSKLKELKDNISSSTADDFNQCVKSIGLQWNKIFKGDFTGYTDGLASKNKGNAFEKYFIEHYPDEFEKTIKSLAGYKELKSIQLDGELNQKRPLTVTSSSITCGPAGDYNIGKTVTDVTLNTDKGPIYLSLKYGSTVTFVNAGIKKLFNKEFFDGGTLDDRGALLLDMLSIDHEKFKEVFNNYVEDGKKKKATYEKVDVTSKLKSNDTFKTFMKSVMGYGFILVHQNSDKSVDYVNLLSSNALNKFLKDMSSATVEYPVGGSAKRINVVVKYKDIDFSINIRSKDGGILPTHIMADYTFKE